ncbi:hypothetical protein GCE9029_03478 [Grimontia celer]|uniref:Uncharacterized protein n=1 Tax=Grimontia celer TaxID=1796497 RepID=A0A128F7U7_9GAMM|nr:hypothetical protein [Grimontia celer]CZF82849.1 hypothetical protein GCE9029_03478 [Grimontia celer]
MNKLLGIGLLLLSLGCPVFAESAGERVLEARNQLKDYALASCLMTIDPESQVAKDLSYTKRSLSFMGKGSYMVIQDEETFETKHDPYPEAEAMMLREAENLVGYLQSGDISKSYGCFRAYQSKAFNDYIISQDGFIVVE